MDAAKKEKLERVVVLLLLVVFLGSLINGPVGRRFFRSQPHEKATAVVSGRLKTIKPLQEMVKERWENTMEQVSGKSSSQPLRKPHGQAGMPRYGAVEMRNPMQSWLPKPLESAPASEAKKAEAPKPANPPVPPALTVQGLFWGDLEPHAIVNGRLCRVGDRIEGAVITAIGRDGVTAEFEGIKLNLDVAPAGAGLRGSNSAQWRR